MQVIEVTNAAQAKSFIEVFPALYKEDPNFIRPLDKDVAEVFDETKNKTFRFGSVKRWYYYYHWI